MFRVRPAFVFCFGARTPRVIDDETTQTKRARRRDVVRRRLRVPGVRQAGRGDEPDPAQAEGLLGEIRPPRRRYVGCAALPLAIIFVALDVS